MNNETYKVYHCHEGGNDIVATFATLGEAIADCKRRNKEERANSPTGMLDHGYFVSAGRGPRWRKNI